MNKEEQETLIKDVVAALEAKKSNDEFRQHLYWMLGLNQVLRARGGLNKKQLRGLAASDKRTLKEIARLDKQ